MEVEEQRTHVPASEAVVGRKTWNVARKAWKLVGREALLVVGEERRELRWHEREVEEVEYRKRRREVVEEELLYVYSWVLEELEAS